LLFFLLAYQGAGQHRHKQQRRANNKARTAITGISHDHRFDDEALIKSTIKIN
jgi:hypothetical protein